MGRPRRRRGSRRAASVLHGHHAAVHLIGSTIWPSKKWRQCKKQRPRTVRTLAALRTARQWGPARMRARASPPGFFASPCSLTSPVESRAAQECFAAKHTARSARAREPVRNLPAMAVDITFRELDTACNSQHGASHARLAARAIAMSLNNALCTVCVCVICTCAPMRVSARCHPELLLARASNLFCMSVYAVCTESNVPWSHHTGALRGTTRATSCVRLRARAHTASATPQPQGHHARGGRTACTHAHARMYAPHLTAPRLLGRSCGWCSRLRASTAQAEALRARRADVRTHHTMMTSTGGHVVSRS